MDGWMDGWGILRGGRVGQRRGILAQGVRAPCTRAAQSMAMRLQDQTIHGCAHYSPLSACDAHATHGHARVMHGHTPARPRHAWPYARQAAPCMAMSVPAPPLRAGRPSHVPPKPRTESTFHRGRTEGRLSIPARAKTWLMESTHTSTGTHIPRHTQAPAPLQIPQQAPPFRPPVCTTNKRHPRRGKVVDVGHAGLEALADCARARLAAKHTRSEPKVAVVRQRDHLVVGVKPDHRHDWPKDLLLPDAHAAPHAQQHGRRVEDAFARRQLPSSQQLGALCDRVIDELLHLFRQARHRHAANVRRPVAKRRALPHARHRRHHASHKRVEHLVVHKEALAAGAVLAAVEERRLDRDLHHLRCRGGRAG
eukprot:365643-Chlamydomonas_euryale.AAC.26